MELWRKVGEFLRRKKRREARGQQSRVLERCQASVAIGEKRERATGRAHRQELPENFSRLRFSFFHPTSLSFRYILSFTGRIGSSPLFLRLSPSSARVFPPPSPILAVSCPSITSPLAMASAQEEANALKLQGNKAFAQHDWPTAVDFYNQAIEKYDKEPSFFSNRAQVRWTPTRAALLPRPFAGAKVKIK